VVFMKEGEVVASRDLRALPHGEIRVSARVRNFPPKAVAELARWGTNAQLDGERLTLATGSTDVLPDILRHLVAAGADVFEFAPEKLSLEDLFLKIMGEDRGL